MGSLTADNGLSCHANQDEGEDEDEDEDEDDGDGSRLFGWDMKQRLDAVMT
jgi:hypothetical protein